MTELSSTCSPFRYHHLASHWWHVENASSVPSTVIAMMMSSEFRQEGQMRRSPLDMTPYLSAERAGEHIVPRVYFAFGPMGDTGYPPYEGQREPLASGRSARRLTGRGVAPRGRPHDDHLGPDGNQRVHGLRFGDVHPDAPV